MGEAKDVEDVCQTFEEMLSSTMPEDTFAGDPKGFLQKPDFKRAKQKVGASDGKKAGKSMFASSAWKTRFFVLDGMMLKYFAGEAMSKELGSIHMNTVKAVAASSIDDAPEHSIDLVSEERIYTLSAPDQASMLQWASVLRSIITGNRRASPSISGPSSVLADAVKDTREGDAGNTGEEASTRAQVVLHAQSGIISGWLWKRGNPRGKLKIGKVQIGSNAFKPV